MFRNGAPAELSAGRSRAHLNPRTCSTTRTRSLMKNCCMQNCSRTWRVLRTWLSAKLLHAKLLPHMAGPTHLALFSILSLPLLLPPAHIVVSLMLQPLSQIATSCFPRSYNRLHDLLHHTAPCFFCMLPPLSQIVTTGVPHSYI